MSKSYDREKSVTRSKLRAPYFEILPHDAVISEGNTATFNCKVTGLPVPTITWTRNVVPITPDNRLVYFISVLFIFSFIEFTFFISNRHVITYDSTTGNCTLTIYSLTFNDQGEYKCTARNSAGQAAVTMQIRCFKGN